MKYLLLNLLALFKVNIITCVSVPLRASTLCLIWAVYPIFLLDSLWTLLGDELSILCENEMASLTSSESLWLCGWDGPACWAEAGFCLCSVVPILVVLQCSHELTWNLCLEEMIRGSPSWWEVTAHSWQICALSFSLPFSILSAAASSSCLKNKIN